MITAPSYFEFIERKAQLDLVEWDDPDEITVTERTLTEEEVERIRRQVQGLTP